MRIIIFLLGILLYSCSSKQESSITDSITLPVINIQTVTTDTYQEYPVTIEGKTNVDIRSQVDGHIIKLFVDEGDYVEKGQSLFKIDELPYLEEYNNAFANLSGVEASLIKTQLDIDRLIPLVDKGIISAFGLKAARANYELTLANISQAKAMVASAKINLGFTLIKAPISGYISRLHKRQGSLISRTDADPLTRLSNIDEIQVYFSLSENDFVYFKQQYEGNTLNDKIKNLPPVSLLLSDNTLYPEKGQIDMIDGQFDRNTGAITLRAVFTNSKGLLRSGNTGKIQLSRHHDNVILVPQSATVEIQDKIFVYVLDENNKVSVQPISIIARSGKDYLIKEGLKAGDRIIAKGFNSLEDGTIITPEREEN